MNTVLNFNIPLSINELAVLLKTQLSVADRHYLINELQEVNQEEEPSKEQILEDLKSDYVALKKGTLKTRPATAFLNELKSEGYL